jgi:drug/metabolite transporter (DMT)-like permease
MVDLTATARSSRGRWRDLPAPLKGMLIMVFSTICFGLMHASIRIMPGTLHGFEKAFFRNFLGALFLLPWFFRHGLAPLRTRHLGLHALRGVLNAISMLMFFVGVTMTPLAEVAAIGFTAPLFATVMAVFVLREPSHLRRWLVMGCGFAGMLILLRPGIQAVGTGQLLLVGAALLWSVALICIRVLSRTDSSLTITVYMAVFLSPIAGIASIPVWQWPHGIEWAWLFFIGLMGNLGQMSLSQALKEAEASVVLPFDFLKLIWGALYGYLAFTEIPDLWTWVGGIVIFASTTYLTVRESR